MKRLCLILLASFSLVSRMPCEPRHDESLLDGIAVIDGYGGIPNRNPERWKTEISEYSRRHYGPAEWKLTPSAIVVHYTASAGFPLNLLESDSYQDEKPGLASHIVAMQTGAKVEFFQILPFDVMSRATFGANFCAISIEMVAKDEDDLLSKPALLDVVCRLVSELMVRYSIPADRVFGHQEVDEMLAEQPNGMFFDRTIEGKFKPRKIDPGKRVMAYIRERISGTNVSSPVKKKAPEERASSGAN